MADIQINELLESTTAANSDWIAIDNGTATKKISVQNFNSTGAASAAQSAAAAAQSASAALAAQTAAEQAEDDTEALITSAQTIVSDAQTYAGEAATSANTASTAANTATAQAAIATQAANTAAGYAQNVDNFAKTAKSWAVGGTGTRQGEDTDNSKYYSQQAHDSEINAAASESAAATSEANAAASETAAAASESNAATSESNAAASETNAATSESNAATSASNAASSESNAATSETNAAASATAAGASEDDSEAWAWGKVNGVDVPPSHPAYHNNAKYYADQASGGVSGVSSFNARTGNVTPQLGDYAANIVEFDNTSSSLQSTTTQDAIEEVQDNVDDVASDLSTLDGSLKPVAKSGAYNDLTGKPTLGTAAAKNATNTIAEDSTDLIEGGAVYDALALKADAEDLGTAAAKDSTNAVTEDSTDLVESGVVFSELATRDAEIADMNNVLGAKNLLPNRAKSQTVNGIAFTVNSDGSVTVNGTASADTTLFLLDANQCSLLDDRGKSLVLSGRPTEGVTLNGGSCQLTVGENVNNTWVFHSDNGSGETFTLNSSRLQNNAYIWITSGVTLANAVFKPMLRLASIQDSTYEPYAMTNQQITPYVQAISNPNLLDNPWFTVNQRGFSSKNDNGFTVDRWQILQAAGTVSLSNGAITIDPTVSGTTFLWGQTIEDALAKFGGKTLTLSVLLSDGTIKSKSFICPTSVSSNRQVANVNLGSTHYFEIYAYTSGHARCGYFNDRGVIPSSPLTIKAVKLELGSVSTLAQDTAPNYATELLKCQRYFFAWKAIINSTDLNPCASGYGLDASTARVTLLLPTHMRTAPSVTVNDVNYFALVYNGKSVTPSSITLAAICGNMAVLKAITSENDLQNYPCCLRQLSYGTIFLSADI